MSGHIAAMAPGTNIGAAHPVNLGGGNPLAPEKKDEGGGEGDPSTGSGQGNEDQGEGEKKPEGQAPGGDDVMGQKILNDTVAFARSIAERQGRNADWAEKAVRESVSVTEKEALKLNVIDVVAEDTRDLLDAIDGRSVKVSGEEVVLSLQNSRIVDRPMKFRHRVLMALSDPNIAYILMMLGIYGLFFELANPGVILPGVVGGIFLILAFFSFHVLSINYAGFLLIFLGIVLFILEVKVVSYGMLSVGGIVSLFLGSMMLFDTGEPYVKLSISIVLAFTLTTALFIVLGLTLVIKSHRKKPTTGVEGMIGERGVASTDIDNTGKVKVHGEIWSATSTEPIKAGDSVVVKGIERMKLIVVPGGNEEAQ
jgi:membrane-bound serine protease (ClpP class)